MDRVLPRRPLVTGRLRRRLVRHYLPLILLSLLAVIALTVAAPGRAAGRAAADPAGAPSHARWMGHESGRAGGDGGPVGSGTMPSADHSSARFDHSSGAGGVPGPLGGLGRPLTTATGYVGLVLLAATLLVGPVNRLARRATPLSMDCRRDLGIWTAVVSLVHVVLGFQVHEGGRWLAYFVSAETLAPRLNTFTLANYTGLAATAILLVLAAISSDAALRRLKVGAWKRLQRLSFAAFALVVVHTALYGALGPRATLAAVLLGASIGGVVIVRAGGAWAARRAVAQSPAR